MTTLDFEAMGRTAINRARMLYPIPRNIVSDGNIQTNDLICSWVGELDRISVGSGTKFGDWIVPESWDLKSYQIVGANSRKNYWSGFNDLGVVVGSTPISKTVSRDELLDHCHVSDTMPNSIPYVTSYYQRQWGFCMPHEVLQSLQEDSFEILIDVDEKAGSMELLEFSIEGKSKREIIVGSYNCHPFMANNELSGIVVWLALLELCRRKTWHHSLRFYLGPETIGAIAYLNTLLTRGRDMPLGALTLTCLGTETHEYTLLEDRSCTSPFTKSFRDVLEVEKVSYRSVPFKNRGSDERQWSSPTLRMLTASLMSSKYHDYPEYHTSADDLSLLSPSALAKSIELNYKFLRRIDSDRFPVYRGVGEPKLDVLGLYPSVNEGGDSTPLKVRSILEFVNLCDGITPYRDVAEQSGLGMQAADLLVSKLEQGGLIEY